MKLADFRYWHKADMVIALSDVRFWGQSGHRIDEPQCPLMTPKADITKLFRYRYLSRYDASK